MAERFKVVIVGSGPGGLSAGARAAALGMSHVVLERERRHAETIQKYQRGKLVMATPDILPLRSDMSFAEGIREHILDTWTREIGGRGVNVRYGAEVAKISGQKGAFRVALRSGEAVEAENVVLAIGVQGDLRRWRCRATTCPSSSTSSTTPTPSRTRRSWSWGPAIRRSRTRWRSRSRTRWRS
jgi:thioredoxin reductase